MVETIWCKSIRCRMCVREIVEYLLLCGGRHMELKTEIVGVFGPGLKCVGHMTTL
jgi:hypothetical protein